MAFSFSKLFSSAKDVADRAPVSMVGIDIGTASVKVVALEQGATALILKTYGELQLGPYAGQALGESVTLDREKTTEAVVDVLREAEVHTKHGVLVMPLSSSFLTVAQITLGPDDDLDAHIPIEAKKYIPLSLNDVTLDWNELTPTSPEPAGKKNTQKIVHEVLLAAIENRALGEYREVQQAIGMVGEPSEIESFSLVRALQKKGDTTLAIIDFGATTAKLLLVNNGVLQRVHRVAQGGVQMTKLLAKMLNVSFEEAENLKRTTVKGSEHEQDVRRAITTVTEGALKEFKRMISVYEMRIGTEVSRVILTGGVAASPFVLAHVQDVLVKQVMIENPFDKVAYPAFMEDTLLSIAPSFGVSLGAALRKFE